MVEDAHEHEEEMEKSRRHQLPYPALPASSVSPRNSTLHNLN